MRIIIPKCKYIQKISWLWSPLEPFWILIVEPFRTLLNFNIRTLFNLNSRALLNFNFRTLSNLNFRTLLNYKVTFLTIKIHASNIILTQKMLLNTFHETSLFFCLLKTWKIKGYRKKHLTLNNALIKKVLHICCFLHWKKSYNQSQNIVRQLYNT